MSAMHNALSIIIMAAGQGKRMNSDLPKVLHTLSGRPFIEHVLGSARKLDPQQCIIIIGHGADQVRSALAQESDLQFALQSPQLGTGHAAMQALPLLNDDNSVALILNGDVPLVQPDTLRKVVNEAAAGKLCLLTHVLPDAGHYGRIIRNDKDAVLAIVEAKDATPEQLKVREWYTGILAAPVGFLKSALARLSNDNAQSEYYLTGIVQFAVEDGIPVTAVQAPHEWEILGINNRQDQALTERAWQQHQANQLLAKGVTLLDPARIDIRGSLHCGRDVVIDVNCVFNGEVELEDGVSIGPNCVLANIRIGAHTRIEAFTHAENVVIGSNARIGPYARLRPGTELADDVHIGNFVEVKATRMGMGSKANHLSYLGDSDVGQHVNIGAGTITCNYDGANKHRTVIEDNVHVGSDVQLVAPVTIARGTTIAAGTTVWKDTQADSLTLNPKQQTTRPGWQRPVKKKQ
jgi:bifunctional UDP-N-acetylglucosamine pyrophosphorylase / glucosamine-1-phosphate N-acetyltransferase